MAARDADWPAGQADVEELAKTLGDLVYRRGRTLVVASLCVTRSACFARPACKYPIRACVWPGIRT